jgi:hypothetical protein
MFAMNPARRYFLQEAVLSIIAANLPLGLFAQHLNNRVPALDPENLTLLDGATARTFEPWIGSAFRVTLYRKPVGSLVLMSVDDMSTDTGDRQAGPQLVHAPGRIPSSASALAISGFSLRFQGTRLPQQDTFTLSHDWLGTFSVFLVPSALSTSQATCTAVFTLLNQTDTKKSE